MMDLKMGFGVAGEVSCFPNYLSLSLSFADVSIPKPKNTLQLQKPSLEVHNFSREFFSQEK